MRSLDAPPGLRIAAALFFAALVGSGVLGHRDYGIGWDEPIQRQFGHAVYDYVLHDDPALLTSHEKYYGPLVEFALVAAEHATGWTDPRPIYFLRHLLTFLLFCLGVFWFYRLATRLFDDPRWGLVAAAFLAASPRIYADAFCNSKDVPLLVFFVGSMLTLHRLARQPGWATALVHGLLCALAINTRVVGLMAPAVTVLFGALALWAAPPAGRRALAAALAGSLAAAGAFTVALWPLLWSSPLTNLRDAVAQAAQFPWAGSVLYRGQFVHASDLPWHYVPAWILITTPVVYLVLAGVGACAVTYRLLRAHAPALRQIPERSLPLLWLLVPWALVTARDAVLYDGWRHLFFIYPALLLLTIDGIRTLVAAPGRLQRALRLLVGGAVGMAWGGAVFAMVRCHPHQNVYFNALVAPDRVRSEFELDYWGTSYRQGLEYVLRHDPRPLVRVWVANDPGRYNSFILPERERQRLAYVEQPDEADYVLSNFRWHPDEYPLPEVFAVTVNHMKILAVYRLPGPES